MKSSDISFIKKELLAAAAKIESGTIDPSTVNSLVMKAVGLVSNALDQALVENATLKEQIKSLELSISNLRTSNSIYNHIIVMTNFSRFPAGRYKEDGPYNGSKFRDEILVPALTNHRYVKVMLDGTMGYGSSFLEEAFGGLAKKGFAYEYLNKHLYLISEDGSLTHEIWDYIEGCK